MRWIIIFCLALSLAIAGFVQTEEPATKETLDATYLKQVRPLIAKYCLECHSKKASKGDLDLERFASADAIRKDIRPWQHLIEQMEAGEMPPANRPQPTALERKTLLDWTRQIIDHEARSRKGDPGRVPLRRLSNTEYDCTIRDLTGVDLKPAREFPADGAGGEGFTNAGESLSDITPALFTRYMASARDIAEHAVLLPDGFRFSPSKARRDWTVESLTNLRKFYAPYGPDGRLVFQPYLAATIRHRDSLLSGAIDLTQIADREKLNAKYLSVLWQTLTSNDSSQPLQGIRAAWLKAAEKDAPALATEITEWQKALWKFGPVGSYRFGAMTRQTANDPTTAEIHAVKFAMKPPPGKNEVVLYLATRDLAPTGKDAHVVWQKPRFEGVGKQPLLLKDYATWGVAFEIDPAAIFKDSAKHLNAVLDVAPPSKLTVADIAKARGLDSALLQRWVELADLKPIAKTIGQPTLWMPATPLILLDEKSPPNAQRPAVKGWRPKGTDLPTILSNASDEALKIPGLLGARKVVVHPMPQEMVAVAWKSPFAATVTISARVLHVHTACGNGVAWRIEHRRGDTMTILSRGAVPLGGEMTLPPQKLEVQIGDRIVLAIDAHQGSHVCDLTEINLGIVADKQSWDLTRDLVNTIHEGNPHADSMGNKDVWSFFRGPAFTTNAKEKLVASAIPGGSILARWRQIATDPERKDTATDLADALQRLLTGPRPTKEKDADQILFDTLVAADGVLLKGLDLSKFSNTQVRLGLPQNRFDGDDLNAPADSIVEIRLPAALFRDREFVAEARVDGPIAGRAVLFDVSETRTLLPLRWNGKSPVVTAKLSDHLAKIKEGHDAFRNCFPFYLCLPNVVPTDEVVSLKMFHREDEPLERLFLDDAQKRELDRLWDEHRMISLQPVMENDYLPQFIGYVTQDQPKQMLDYYLGQKPVFQKRAEAFHEAAKEAEPRQLAALEDFAERAYRRPLATSEKDALLGIYQGLRAKKMDHEDAFRGALTRLLVSPTFLFRIESPPPGRQPGPISDWELATRLSYFLWSSMPDGTLRQIAAQGKLRDPAVLEAQTLRMLQDDRLRAMAIEFGTQWIHVREFDMLKEKNEKLFPTFTPALRQAIYEESILFFQDLFQKDRAVLNLLDADATYLNEMLANHYEVPGVKGPQWRRIEGIRKYGRGGILGLASVQAKQSGASRTSPVLRGNWVVETLLGEKLPRPPANVPILPDQEGGDDQRTTRQQVERHVSDKACASCHVRIDPFGFAFENFDAIGRWRTKETSGLAVDTRAKLRDGVEFEGIDGLRTYLLTKKKDVIVRLFCQRLLGYALGRSTTLADTSLIDEMVSSMQANEGRVSASVLTIVRSPQFRMTRGAESE